MRQVADSLRGRPSVRAVVVPGDYRIEVTRPSTTRPGTTIAYWYAGQGVAPSSTESGAATVHLSGSTDQSISMTVH